MVAAHGVKRVEWGGFGGLWDVPGRLWGNLDKVPLLLKLFLSGRCCSRGEVVVVDGDGDG